MQTNKDEMNFEDWLKRLNPENWQYAVPKETYFLLIPHSKQTLQIMKWNWLIVCAFACVMWLMHIGGDNEHDVDDDEDDDDDIVDDYD